MEQQLNRDTSFDNSYPDEMLNLANNQIDEVMSSALHSLTRILSSPCISLTTTTTTASSSPSSPFRNPSTISTPNCSLQPNVTIRCRSSSRNNRREREVPFHHTIPRCSLPATKNDLVQYHQSHVLTSQKTNHTRCRSSHNVNRTFDIQYSFSLNKPWLTQIDKERHNLISIQNFANELIEHSIRTALLQIDYQNITDESTSIYDDDTSCVLFDCSPSYVPIERFQIINTYIDQFVHLTIKQSIEDITFSNDHSVEHLSNRLTENVISDALLILTNDEASSTLILTDDEKNSRKSKRRSTGNIRLINNENNESQPSLFQQIRHRSSSALRSLSTNHIKRDTVDSIVNNLTQQIYIDSFDELRRILTKNDGI
ncbi:unnamed protein product [Adineta steineri]|uniref:Uncharacterized protein n=2 Tax=Adineta steineri TaxID=433720 RepID=A0A819FAD6_9BILA|nr:unnamed protein product [Adineta steineri]